MTQYQDLADLDEDERIQRIGEYAMTTGAMVSFVTENDSEKANRYIMKLTSLFPLLRVVLHGPGPVANTIIVKVRKMIPMGATG